MFIHFCIKVLNTPLSGYSGGSYITKLSPASDDYTYIKVRVFVIHNYSSIWTFKKAKNYHVIKTTQQLYSDPLMTRLEH